MRHPHLKKTPPVILIAAYFGPLPAHFQLWLDSCGYNEDVDWLVFTDAATGRYGVPPNVRIVGVTLNMILERLGRAAGLPLRANSAYKLCDYRPLFWALLEDGTSVYDFWGHCDVDMIFGRLSLWLTPERMASYDKLFSVGHLTIYRNFDVANQMYRQPHPRVDWRTIFLDPCHRGFDEHFGVNRIWRGRGGRVFEDESIIADIDPAIGRFERAGPWRNYRRQLFYFDHGRVCRAYATWAGWRCEEFMYVHFQKRAMTRLPVHSPGRYAIAPGGFYDLPQGVSLADAADRWNRPRFSWPELAHKARLRARRVRNLAFSAAADAR